MIEHEGRKALNEIMSGVGDITPGKWRVVIDDDGNVLSGRPDIFADEKMDCAIVHWDGFIQRFFRGARGDKEIHANAMHLARCHAENFRAIDAFVKEQDAKIERLRSVLIGIASTL